MSSGLHNALWSLDHMWLTETGGSLPLGHSFNVLPGTCRECWPWIFTELVLSTGGRGELWPPLPTHSSLAQCWWAVLCFFARRVGLPSCVRCVFYFILFNFLEGFAALGLIAVADFKWRFLVLVCQPKWLCHHPAPPDDEQQLTPLWINSPLKARSLEILWAELYIW